MPRISPAEGDLVDRMRSGEQRAFDQFFSGYAGRLAAFAARRSALDEAALEDVVQVTLVKAMRGLASFRGDSSLYTWLCGICRNQLADSHRKSARNPATVSLDEPGALESKVVARALLDAGDPAHLCAIDSTRTSVRQTIEKLPTSYAHILELRFGDDLTVPEIARILGLSEHAAESRLGRARRAFRLAWNGEPTDMTAQA